MSHEPESHEASAADFDFAAVSDLLRCPQTQAPLVFDGQRLISTDAATRLSYNVKHGIPNLLVQDAVTLSEEEWQSAMTAAEQPGADG